MVRYYDRSGSSRTLYEWAELLELPEYKQVAETNVGETWVSTVWLGLDHQFGGGPPLIFETMVFGGPLDQEMDRYSTETEAVAGHETMVAQVHKAQS